MTEPIPAEAFYPPPGYTGPRVQDYPGWKCGDCGCDNHAGEAFCFRCGACQPDDEDQDC